VRARLYYRYVLSPRVPAQLTRAGLQLLLLAAAVAGILAVCAGYSPVVVIAQLCVAVGGVA